jgi:hypothetical protein
VVRAAERDRSPGDLPNRLGTRQRFSDRPAAERALVQRLQLDSAMYVSEAKSQEWLTSSLMIAC